MTNDAFLLRAARVRRRPAGFTLVELMVALTGGLFVSLAVFALARDSGRFYQRESRVANATVGALLGFERLRTDIARAGFLSSPNAFRDPSVCPKPAANWPLALRSLASIRITPKAASGALLANGRTPPTLVLAGSYSSSDVFSGHLTPAGNNMLFTLTVGSPALLRLGNGSNPTRAAVKSVFATGRALRFVQYGKQYYGQIIDATGDAAPTVTINAAPPIQQRSGSLVGCGAHIIDSGAGVGTINVVNFIQYDVRSLATNANYASLYSNSAAGPGEAGRTELVRVEQDINGVPIPETEELVAEYAVDLDFQLTAVPADNSSAVDPTVTSVPATATAFATFTGDVYNSNVTPELIRTLRVRLGVRSREGDRPADIGPDADAGANRGLYRFNIGADAGSDAYARVRTFQADVALHNQLDALW